MKRILLVGFLVVCSYAETSVQSVALVEKKKIENSIKFKNSEIKTILNFQRKAKTFKDKKALLKKLNRSDKDKLLNLMLIDQKELKALDVDGLTKIKIEWIQLPLPGFGPVIVVPTPKPQPKIPNIIIKPEFINKNSLSNRDIRGSTLAK